jgi:hypothetical protein
MVRTGDGQCLGFGNDVRGGNTIVDRFGRSICRVGGLCRVGIRIPSLTR